MEPIEGGQSGTAPSCSEPTDAASRDQEVMKETRGIVKEADLVVQVSKVVVPVGDSV